MLGKPPKAYFYLGDEFPIGINGEVCHYPPKTWTQGLPSHNGGKDVILTAPGKLKTADLQWLSIYSPDYDQDLGHVIFPHKKPRKPN